MADSNGAPAVASAETQVGERAYRLMRSGFS